MTAALLFLIIGVELDLSRGYFICVMLFAAYRLAAKITDVTWRHETRKNMHELLNLISNNTTLIGRQTGLFDSLCGASESHDTASIAEDTSLSDLIEAMFSEPQED